MHTIKCEKCDWKTTKPTKNSAEQSLRMHFGRKHGNIKIINSHSLKTDKPKRAYKKQTQKDIMINYCPNCGLSLHDVALGMVLSTKMK